MISLGDRAPDELRAEGFVDVCDARSVPGLTALRVEVDGRGVLVCRHRMRYVAFSEICPHRELSMADATLPGGGVIVCPHHQYAFDLESGECVTRATCAGLTTWPVEVSGGRVWIRIGAT